MDVQQKSRDSEFSSFSLLTSVFSSLSFSPNGLVLNLEKYSFAQMKIDYLRHNMSPSGIVPLCRHGDALFLQPSPQDICGLQRFLGMVNFYRHFLPMIAKNPVRPACGRPSAPCLVSSTKPPWLSTPSPMAWWRGSTENWKIPYMLAWPPPTGLNTYLGFCWDYILLPGKTLPPLPQMPSTTNQFYENLRNWMSDFCPVPACHNTLSTTDLPEQIPTSLYSCLMVLIHKDGHVPPLAPLYEGPYKVFISFPFRLHE